MGWWRPGYTAETVKKVALAVVAVVAVLSAVVVVRALSQESLQPGAEEAVHLEVDTAALAARFAQAITFPTISNQDRSDIDHAAFLGLHEHFAVSYPLVHEHLALEKVHELSLLYTWLGSNPALAPVLLMGHQDVVPVIPGTEDDWLQAAPRAQAASPNSSRNAASARSRSCLTRAAPSPTA